MYCKKLMLDEICTIGISCDISTAGHIFAANCHETIFVVDSEWCLHGIITMGDFFRKAAASKDTSELLNKNYKKIEVNVSEEVDDAHVENLASDIFFDMPNIKRVPIVNNGRLLYVIGRSEYEAAASFSLNGKFIAPLDVDIDFDDDFINHVTGVVFELSNTCNYAHIHSQCPCSWYAEKTFLDESIVFKVIDELASVGFNGTVKFHRYNEPMLDKQKLYRCIDYVNNKLPLAKIIILTNGSLLFQDDIAQLEKFKIHTLSITAYNKDEYRKFVRLKTKIPIVVYNRKLDDRGNIYTREPLGCKKPCYATIRDVTVNCYGQVSLCCLDWDNRFIFGDLRAGSLREVLNSRDFLNVHKSLTRGERVLEICKRCDLQR